MGFLPLFCFYIANGPAILVYIERLQKISSLKYSMQSMQRWNDKIRPVDLRELDKQAHKMIIAYFF